MTAGGTAPISQPSSTGPSVTHTQLRQKRHRTRAHTHSHDEDHWFSGDPPKPLAATTLHRNAQDHRHRQPWHHHSCVCACMAVPGTRGWGPNPLFKPTHGTTLLPVQAGNCAPNVRPLPMTTATSQLLECRARRRELRVAAACQPTPNKGISGWPPLSCCQDRHKVQSSPKGGACTDRQGTQSPQTNLQTAQANQQQHGRVGPNTRYKAEDPASFTGKTMTVTLWVAHPKNHAIRHMSVPRPGTPPTPGTRPTPLQQRVRPAANTSQHKGAGAGAPSTALE